MDISTLRKEYKHKSLRRQDLLKDPLEQFRKWFHEAQEAKIPEPNAFVLATATTSGRPSSRTVLLKKLEADGLIFFTNYQSRKAQEIEANPFASATFLWIDIGRQITVEGTIEKITNHDSEVYFSKRPKGSQLSTWASAQGEILESRDKLLEKYQIAEKRFPSEVPKPPHWGGFRLHPSRWEFWQGQENRLHDRFQYRKVNRSWTIERLSP